MRTIVGEDNTRNSNVNKNDDGINVVTLKKYEFALINTALISFSLLTLPFAQCKIMVYIYAML